MKKKSTKEFNLMKKWGVTDEEVADIFRIDKRLANTPDLNKAVLDAVEKRNIHSRRNRLIAGGMDYFEATKQAEKYAKDLRKAVKI